MNNNLLHADAVDAIFLKYLPVFTFVPFEQYVGEGKSTQRQIFLTQNRNLLKEKIAVLLSATEVKAVTAHLLPKLLL